MLASGVLYINTLVKFCICIDKQIRLVKDKLVIKKLSCILAYTCQYKFVIKKTCHRNLARRPVRGLKQLFPSYTIERENEGRCENPRNQNNTKYFVCVHEERANMLCLALYY